MTYPNQFGFKPKHNTEMCIVAGLKEVILKYRALNSNVYSCFLDASKAFENAGCFFGASLVNHLMYADNLVVWPRLLQGCLSCYLHAHTMA